MLVRFSSSTTRYDRRSISYPRLSTPLGGLIGRAYAIYVFVLRLAVLAGEYILYGFLANWLDWASI